MPDGNLMYNVIYMPRKKERTEHWSHVIELFKLLSICIKLLLLNCHNYILQ